MQAKSDDLPDDRSIDQDSNQEREYYNIADSEDSAAWNFENPEDYHALAFSDEVDFLREEPCDEEEVRALVGEDPAGPETKESSLGTEALVLPLDNNIENEMNVSALSLWHGAVDSACQMLSVKSGRLPWERGFAGLVFNSGEAASNALTRPHMPEVKHDPALSMEPASKKFRAMGSWKQVIHRISRLQWNVHDEALRNKALGRWKYILSKAEDNSKLGRALLNDVMSLCSDSALEDTLKSVFVNKSTGTLLKRASPIILYMNWCHLKNVAPFPIQESLVHGYMLECCLGQIKPSKFQSLRESLNFSSGTLGLDGAKETANEPRVRGLSDQHLLRRRPLKQANTLTVKQMDLLQDMLLKGGDLADRVFSGHCLFVAYGRCRWSDAQWPTEVTLDLGIDGHGYIQANTRKSKTSSSIQKKLRFLPLTAPTLGISWEKWHEAWINCRDEAGLTFTEGKPMMPGVLINGQFGNEPLQASEASKWLREILIRGGSSPEEVAGVSSHSLKATCLSWAAKFGLDPATRRTLGYHIQPGSASLLHYSRDELSTPLRKLAEVLSAIRSGVFNPDSTRSGYFQGEMTSGTSGQGPSTLPASSGAEELVQPPIGEKEPALEEVCSSSSSSSSEESCKEDELTMPGLDGLSKQELSTVTKSEQANDKLYKHKRWLTLHWGHCEQPRKLACGRQRNEAYDRMATWPEFPLPKCKNCFGTEGVASS